VTPGAVDVVVVGAGAAGLAAAIFAARAAPQATIVALDGARKIGAKILVAGGGRCNVTNATVTPADFWGGSRNVIRRVLAAAPIYARQVCLDLLKSKLDAMDAGREASFKVTQAELCDRCRAVFAELDVVQDACADLARGELPQRLRAAIISAMNERPAAGVERPRRGRRPVSAPASRPKRRESR